MDWKKTLSSVAPTIAKALGGPLAGTAVKFLADKFLGNPDASQAEVQKYIEAGMSPEQLLGMQTLETNFKEHMADLGIDLEKINAADRDSARNREIKTGDSLTPRILAAVTLIGYFVILSYLLNHGLPTNGGDAILLMLGALQAAILSIYTYYYGSSATSAAKTDAMAKAMKP